MAFGICNLSIVPVRAEASDKSEMVTQLLFGESFEITQKRGNWLHIRCDYDQYKGWIDHKQYLPLSDEAHAELMNANSAVVSDLLMIAEPEDPMQAVTVMLGSSLPHFDNGIFQLGDQRLEFSGNIAEPSESRELLMQYALMFLNTPYLWGGRSPFGIDCSGFVQVVFKLMGKPLPRDARDQALLGETLSFIEECLPGDLAFFDNDEGAIVHVGIIMPDHQIIHASGKVRMDKIDQQGIFNTETGKHTHKLRVLRRNF